MAHKSNVVQVPEGMKSDARPASQQESVVDPVCGMKMTRRECRHMMFRDDDVFYFCSKACESKFRPGVKSSHAA